MILCHYYVIFVSLFINFIIRKEHCPYGFTKKRKYLSVKEAATEYFEKLISVSALYNLINSGQIKTIKLGHKILIPISELDNYCGKALSKE